MKHNAHTDLQPNVNSTTFVTKREIDTFGIHLKNNEKFWQCFANKWLENHQIEFVKNRYLMFIGGTIYTNDRCYYSKPFTAANINELLTIRRSQQYDEYNPLSVGENDLIIFDCVTREWYLAESNLIIFEMVRHKTIVLPNKKSMCSFANMGKIDERKYKHISPIKLLDQMKNDTKSLECIQMSFEMPLDWDIERVVWIAFYKNQDNEKCCLPKLPKEVVKYILEISKCCVYERYK